MSRCCAYVDVAAYRRNLEALHRVVSVPILAVVKADAYGHGSVELARAARLVDGIAGFCVATLEEGVRLRDAGIDDPILVFTPVEDAVAAAGYRLAVSVSNREHLDLIASAPQHQRPRVHVEVDTGMHRMGIGREEFPEFMEHARDQTVDVAGIYTHFSSADEDGSGPTRRQLGRFAEIDRAPDVLFHAANSAAALRYPEARFGAVRLGGSTFGLSTGVDEIFDLTEPILSLEAMVLRVFDLAPGEGIGYGLEDLNDSPRRIAVLGIGYGDGLPRSLGHGAPVLIGGRRRQIVGRVSMDFTAVDATGTEVAVADSALLVGQRDGQLIRAEDLARHARTSSYDVTTGLLPRVPRIHINRDKATGDETRATMTLAMKSEKR